MLDVGALVVEVFLRRCLLSGLSRSRSLHFPPLSDLQFCFLLVIHFSCVPGASLFALLRFYNGHLIFVFRFSTRILPLLLLINIHSLTHSWTCFLINSRRRSSFRLSFRTQLHLRADSGEPPFLNRTNIVRRLRQLEYQRETHLPRQGSAEEHSLHHIYTQGRKRCEKCQIRSS